MQTIWKNTVYNTAKLNFETKVSKGGKGTGLKEQGNKDMRDWGQKMYFSKSMMHYALSLL